MFYCRIKLVNYIGIFNGMGLDSIEIDFTKCRHNIVVIKGMNGVGKSTLLSSLNLFPEGSGAFVPYKDSRKEIDITDGTNMYTIQLLSPADNNGGRKVTKAFIQKNGVELNPNGNVSSYKDIVFSEFELDSNFLSLTSLTADKKGLGSLTPAERKRFVSSIIDNLEVYNEMYKNLNKKSSIFKSHINNLHTKIQNIGSRDAVEATLNSLREKASGISNRVMELNNLIVSLNAKYALDEEETVRLNKVNNDILELTSKIDSIRPEVNTYARKTGISSTDIENTYNEHKQALSQYEVELQSSKDKWISATGKYNDNAMSITSIKAELSTFENENSDSNIEEKYNNSMYKVNSLIADITSYGYSADESLILPAKTLLSIIATLIKEIDALYYESTLEDMHYIVYDYDPDRISKLQKQLEDTYNKISANESELGRLREQLRTLSVLENRPKGCKIDDCPFIKEAINIKQTTSGKSIISQIEALQRSQETLSYTCTEITNLIVTAQEGVNKRTIYGRIRSTIEENRVLFEKFNFLELINMDKLDKLLSNMNPFNKFREPRELIEVSNLLELYSAEYKVYSLLEVQYNSYKDKERLIASNKNLLSRLEEEQKKLGEEATRYKSDYDKFLDLKNSLSSRIIDEEKYIGLYNNLLELESQRNECNRILDEYKEKSAKAVEALSNINSYKDEINYHNRELDPINLEINRLSGQLTLLDSFSNEFEQYNQKYTVIETLKKYCSVSGGIQSVFMQIYMSKTLELSNQILSLLFNGEYKLVDFVINPNEFRIPFIGNGLMVDDISSGSSSQVCMMSCIINLVLLYQSSTRYMVARLDEVDAPLDSFSRAGWVQVLHKVLELLHMDQLFIISHSIELDACNADIIQLKDYDSYESESGNVIWDYNEIIKGNTI